MGGDDESEREDGEQDGRGPPRLGEAVRKMSENRGVFGKRNADKDVNKMLGRVNSRDNTTTPKDAQYLRVVYKKHKALIEGILKLSVP